MKPEVKEQWVAALRSGEYKQGAHVLKSERYDGVVHCCLGVLCDLHSKATNTPWSEKRRDYDLNYDLCTTTLPNSVMKWAGLPQAQGATVLINERALPLTSHNDRGRSFAEIADAIEEQL